ncbi:MAG: hypothetical protein IPI85_02110 [Dehalococcoidia bacterium]|nr:hypothetical protein [Dehalococcoidia bacterium]
MVAPKVTIPVTGRTNISTYQFAGTPLASITDLGFSAYNTVAAAPCLHGHQRGLRSHRHLAASARVRAHRHRRPLAGPPGPVTPGTTAKSWNTILAQYPNARIRVSDAHVGIRVGNPGPVETSNIDRFVFGTDLSRTLFDFEPTAPCTTTCYVNDATGNDLNDGATTLTPKKTIQAGVNAVNAGGTVNVAAGAYNERDRH